MWKWATGVVILGIIVGSALAGKGVSAPRNEWEIISRPYSFNITRYEIDNFFSKWVNKLKQSSSLDRLNEEEKATLVLKYLDLARQIETLEEQIARGKAENAASENELTSWDSQLQALLRESNRTKSQAEEIIEAQVSQILAEQGLAITFRAGRNANLVFPPVDFGFSYNPDVMVVSPRDKIEIHASVLIEPEVNVEDMVAMESAVAKKGYSGLVEGTGGVATYPSMVQARDIRDLLSVVAHEWLHHYFFFHPLGRHYWSSGEMTTINETAASIGGDEIGQLVYQRFYQKDQPSQAETSPPITTDPQAFDFFKKMREIRLAVDDYLAKGQIDEAEGYMEQQRRVLAANGFYMRKLNQAYFAFHGTYADTPGSVSPIGGQLRELRERSLSVGAFIKEVSRISTPEQLQQIVSP